MKHLSLISIFLILLSCKKNNSQYNISCYTPTNDINISHQLFPGKWTWVSELYRVPLTGQYILRTPATEGYTKQILVSANTITYFKNNNFAQKYLYEFLVEKSITLYPDDTTNILVFKNFITGERSNYVHYKICNDTLTLNFQIRSDVAGQEKWFKTK